MNIQTHMNSRMVFIACLACGTALIPTGCVDKNYDLEKDIDLTVTIGGEELTLPVSSTDVYTMAQILDLDPESSSIKPVEQDGMYGLRKGDYVLTQTGDPSASTVSVDAVNLTDIRGSRTVTDLDQFVVVAGMPEITVSTGEIASSTLISDDNVTADLKSLSWAETDCVMTLEVYYESDDYSGDAIVKSGFKAVFDPSWTVEITDPATRAFARMTDSHTLEFTADQVFSVGSNPLRLAVNVTAFDLTGLPAGQGLYAEGHFRLDSKVVFSGDVAIASSSMASGQANLRLVTQTAIPTAKLLAVRGVVDPDININPTSFEISDIPDFLSEPGNNLDVENPQLYLTVTNTSPVPVTINAMLVAHDHQGETRTAGIGSRYGTDEILIDGNSTTRICVCRTGNVSDAGVKAIKVEALGDLLATVPELIEVTQIEAKADQSREVTFRLNDPSHPMEYEFNATYDAVIPLAFGEQLAFTYEKTEGDWDEDLEKYNFDRVNINMEVVNTVPLNMTPRIMALDRNNEPLPDIEVEMEGTAKAGNLATPTTALLRATLKSKTSSIRNLNGLRICFDASTDAACSGQNLNEEQALRFSSIRISITGGITVDLN